MAKFKYRMKKDIRGVPVGKHRIGKTVINPGDEVTVDRPSELGGALFKFDCLNGEQVQAEETVASQPTAKLELVFVGNDENPDQYDVVNSETGQELNVNPLCKQDACSLAGIDFVPDTTAENAKKEAPAPATKKRTRRKSVNKK